MGVVSEFFQAQKRGLSSGQEFIRFFLEKSIGNDLKQEFERKRIIEALVNRKID